jgi:predicted transcriptional regulator with HTH domain
MKISNKKKEKISEQIMALLYSLAPKAIYTSHIAQEIARDEEFVKVLLLDLTKKGLIVEIKKNPNGEAYSRRIRWRISDKAYNIYKQKQIVL